MLAELEEFHRFIDDLARDGQGAILVVPPDVRQDGEALAEGAHQVQADDRPDDQRARRVVGSQSQVTRDAFHHQDGVVQDLHHHRGGDGVEFGADAARQGSPCHASIASFDDGQPDEEMLGGKEWVHEF